MHLWTPSHTKAQVRQSPTAVNRLWGRSQAKREHSILVKCATTFQINKVLIPWMYRSVFAVSAPRPYLATSLTAQSKVITPRNTVLDLYHHSRYFPG